MNCQKALVSEMQAETFLYVGETDSRPARLVSIGGRQPDPAGSPWNAQLSPIFSRSYIQKPCIHARKPVNIGILNERLKNHGRNQGIVEAGVDRDVLADLSCGSDVLKRQIHLNEFHLFLKADQLLWSS